MASVFDVAKYILKKEGKMSTWKLQKLCYYAQAWSLAWTGNPIFEEEFQAWANGPVCPDLFRLYQGKFSCSEEDLSKGDPNNLNDDQKETVDIIIRDYGKMDPYELRELTHSEDPWKNARQGIPEGTYCNNPITTDSMGEYYGSL